MTAKKPPPWPADKIERRKIDKLIPYANNARTHSDAQVAQIAASMKEWGWTNPVLIEKSGTIIAGHGRVLAARQLGIDEISVMIATGWSKAQIKAYALADNQLALNADWDHDILRVELQGLEELDFDLAALGFSDFNDVTANGELTEDPYKSVFEVAVECSGESEQEKVYNLLVKEGYKCRILTM